MSTLLSELTAGCAFLFGTVLFIFQYVKGNLPAAIIMPVVFIFLGIASVNDIYCHECSYITQGIIFFGGIGYAFIFKPVRNVAMAAICCIVLSLIDLLYRRLRNVDFAIGFADITVITGVSCIVEPIAIPFMLFFSCAFALISIPIAKKNQRAQHTEENSLGVGLLPFVTYGAFVAEILAEQVAPYLLSISA